MEPFLQNMLQIPTSYYLETDHSLSRLSPVDDLHRNQIIKLYPFPNNDIQTITECARILYSFSKTEKFNTVSSLK